MSNIEPEKLENAVYDEETMLKLLGADKGTLDQLRREAGFPFVRLTRVKRVYLAKDVLGWLEQRSKSQRQAV